MHGGNTQPKNNLLFCFLHIILTFDMYDAHTCSRKSAELCETQLIRKENELRSLHEKFDAEIIHAKVAAKEEILREIALRVTHVLFPPGIFL